MKKGIKLIIVNFLVAICVFVLCSCSSRDNKQKEVVEIGYAEYAEYSSLTEMIESVKPSVVDINVYGTTFTAAGSGVIVGKSDDKYYIITNHHVVSDANYFEVVVYPDDKQNISYEGKLVGTSIKTDIAVISIETDGELVCATFIDDSNQVKVGSEVIAIGNPLGILGGSVTHGIISAVEREVYVSNMGYMKLMQTDAAINSGNSGGALFNSNGLLIGIINSGYADYEGLNFAIPANTARESLASIINTYHISGNNYGYLTGETKIGINLASATVYSSSSLDSQTNIIYVESVDAGSDAAKAGICDYESVQSGKNSIFYAIYKINGTAINSINDVLKMLQNVKAGEKITITYREVTHGRSMLGPFTSYVYYISSDIKTVTINTTQYIYTN